MRKAITIFLVVCGVAGVLDVLFFEGLIGVWLSKYLSLLPLFKLL